ncbi:MAG TPA: histidine--tRNA ligase [Chthoniobacteraceae bacterium]|nr:histidine--tRNA ligase [Chthoniobacteraceae bacterium]
MQLLPGFRDFFPEECARRNYILATWREVARRYGFMEYDGPMLETVELYKKKSGGELVGQLFDFTDKGERHVTLRPEMTPTLARMIIAREREFKKPIKWFCAPQFFRYEKQQRGRLREFYQLNCDIIGESSPAADAELVALTIDILREFGLGHDDFVVRVSDRDAWLAFLSAHGIDAARAPEFLQIIDKLERETPEATAAKLVPFGISLEALNAFIANPGQHFDRFNALAADLDARGLKGFYQLDPTIVRGLAYYTGLVYEVFDRRKSLRAVAGGGRYDHLLHDMSDGKVSLPAIGFGMGDVVLFELIQEVPKAAERLAAWTRRQRAADLYVVVASETRRHDALSLVGQLRGQGLRVDLALSPTKVGKQFAAAEHLGARFALVIGDEWPSLQLKNLATREAFQLTLEELPARLPHFLSQP